MPDRPPRTKKSRIDPKKNKNISLRVNCVEQMDLNFGSWFVSKKIIPFIFLWKRPLGLVGLGLGLGHEFRAVPGTGTGTEGSGTLGTGTQITGTSRDWDSLGLVSLGLKSPGTLGTSHAHPWSSHSRSTILPNSGLTGQFCLLRIGLTGQLENFGRCAVLVM